MTENQRLRELLKEARKFVECFADAGEHSLDGIASFKVDLPKDGYPRQVAVCAAADAIARIDAALAEPSTDPIANAYRRGAEAMREQAASLFDGGNSVPGLMRSPEFRDFIRTLPIPEDT
jgi:hypothetical protein